MEKVVLEDEIKKLDIDKQVIKKLKQNNILIINELWKLKQNDLKKLGINSSEMNHLRIKLQLHSLDLNKRTYKKN